LPAGNIVGALYHRL